ncbi:hypothetical protein AB0395_12810 [Streptosporangium sp. NPDC051023]|uniref:ABC transporter permease n=1 Tax=Streptosporangium sp. NPDC051023 TaxID=3155410 RepID=UPI00344D634C
MIATLRHEFGMQIRRPVLWIVYGLAFTLLVVNPQLGYLLPDVGSFPHDTTAALLAMGDIINAMMPMVYGCLLADRLVRDRRLGVTEVLNTTPAGRTGRLLGKYLGACAATATPIALMYFGRVLVYAIIGGRPGALPLSMAVFAATSLPGLLFTGALALAGPLLMPVQPFRVLFVGYWCWSSLISPDMMPTVAYSILSPGARYARFALFGVRFPPGVQAPSDYEPYRPTSGAAFDALRPVGTPAVAFLWMGVMVALTAAVLLLIRLHTARTEH